MKVNDVLQCSFSAWYGPFSSLTFKSAVLPLSSDVLDYLTADGIFVDGGIPHDDEAGLAERSRSDSGGETSQHGPSVDFKCEVNSAIAELGGEVFPKLNWSSPKDATWITPTKALKCTNSDDVFLLLKSSDFIMHDLTEPFLECSDVIANVPPVQYVLVLRKWMDMSTSDEFRCFVKDGDLVALAENGNHQCKLTKTLASFFENSVKAKFPLSSYVFDAYVDGDKVTLMDFNPWGIVTDSLLFTWDELNAPRVKSDDASASTYKTPELRVITDAAVRPVDPFAGLHGVPLEYHRLAMDVSDSGKQPFEALMDLMQAHRLSEDEDMQEQ